MADAAQRLVEVLLRSGADALFADHEAACRGAVECLGESLFNRTVGIGYDCLIRFEFNLRRGPGGEAERTGFLQ